jgi:PAS domain S-box-containing protein
VTSQAEATPTVVVVDDSAEVRLLVKTRLRISRLVDVVGEGATGAEAIELVRRHQSSLLLLDVSMPEVDGLQALPEVRKASPGTRVVFYSGFDERDLAARAVELGADGFIEKSASIDTLADELLAVLGPESACAREETAAPAHPVRAPLARTADDQRVLDEHLERFREVFDEAAIGMATVTLAGHVVRANRTFATLVQRSGESLVGRAYAEFTDGQSTLVDDALDDIRRNSVDLVQIEHDVAGVDPPRRVLASLAPVRDSSGGALYLFMQVQDVTSQRAAEEELRRSEQRFRLLVDSVEDYAIFMLAPDGTVVSWNAGAQRSNGYTADEMIGRHFRVFYPSEVQASGHPELELELALRDGRYSEEGWRVRKDGSRFWANAVITAVLDEDGTHVGFAKVTRDVTALREAQQTLHQSEERFRLIVQAVQDYAIFMLDQGGHVASWNAGAERTKGYTADEIIGQHFRVFYPPEVQASRHPENELEIAMREGHYEEEGWRVRKDGTRFWANVVITALFNDNGEHVGFSKVTRDISERRALLQEREATAAVLASANGELKALNERLTRSAQDQSQFLAVTAHELRTPVGVLGGSADTLARHWSQLTDVEREEMLQGMTSSANRLRRLLGDLLTASRLDARALELHPEQVDLADLVGEAVAAARRTHPDTDIRLEQVEHAAAYVDADKVAQAVDNLLGNALRHGAPPVVVSVVADALTVQVRVTDAGAGVPPALRARLFERFATGDTKRGTGLGLFIVRELARAQGGDATYEPGVPEGAGGTFVVSVPRAGASAAGHAQG